MKVHFLCEICDMSKWLLAKTSVVHKLYTKVCSEVSKLTARNKNGKLYRMLPLRTVILSSCESLY